MEYFYNLFSTIEILAVWSYLLIFILAFFESFAFIGRIVPGSAAVVVGGFLVAQGTLSIGNLFLFAALGAILGSGLSFYLGWKRTINFRSGNKIFKHDLLKKGESYLKKYGMKGVVFGRFIGWARPVIPFASGFSRSNRKIFLLWNILGGLLWAVFYLALGYFFGRAWLIVASRSVRAGFFLGVIISLVIVFYLLKWLLVERGKRFFKFIFSISRSVKQAIINNSDVQKFTAKHPIVFNFLRRRVDKNTLSGLPLSVIVLALLYVLFLFGGVVEDVITNDLINTADTRFANLLAVFRSPALVKIFLWITLLGKWQVILAFLIAAAIILWLMRKRLYIMPLFLSVAGGGIFTYLGKTIFHRARPALAIYTEKSFSFPSGHTVIAMAFYGFLTFILIRSARRWKTKINSFFAGSLIIVSIAFSRLYLGVHYLSDVWGGLLVGALWVIIAATFTEWLWFRKRTESVLLSRAKAVIVSALIVSAAAVFYVSFAWHYNPALNLNLPSINEVIVQSALDPFSGANKQIRYTETLTGNRQEPISFIIIADNDRELVKLFEQSGWYLADNINIYSSLKAIQSAIQKKEYNTAPMTPSFWNTQVHDLGFEKPTKLNSIRQRHHARFWRTHFVTSFGRQIYVGTASFDVGIKWGITHIIKPDIDSEREFLLNDLKSSGILASIEKKQLVKPTLGNNFARDPFFTDGKVYIITTE